MEINRVIRNLNGAIITIEIDGVEYRPVEKEPEPKPRTGHALKVDGKRLLVISSWSAGCRFREDPNNSRYPDIVDADGMDVGHVWIRDGEVSVE